jgi:aminopeptidase N
VNGKAMRHLVLLATLLLSSVVHGQVRHALDVSLLPQEGRISVRDVVSLPEDAGDTLQFTLHEGLSPRIEDEGVRLSEDPEAAGPSSRDTPHARRYRVELPAGRHGFTLEYAGSIRHPVEASGKEYGRSFSTTPGTVSPEGVFLSGASYWYPQFGDRLVGFDMRVRLPAGWSSVSQGTRSRHEVHAQATADTWTEESPQEEIYLIAGPFHEYGQQAGEIAAMAFLRRPDPQLAGRYLDATGRYLRMYGDLIGPYPYRKFALVENFWESGYGMPSFTLLGPRVIRLPFILDSSYPHEILHNWWGNGVYVDYGGGNWAEGLTSYLADHLLKEQGGQGVDYRRTVLQKYTDYVRGNRDFPLSAFHNRHSAATEAVGYGKALMLFHMLRLRLGDAGFIEGLRRLYRDHLFTVAGYADVEADFESVSGEPLDWFFRQWVAQTGAPVLRVRDAHAAPYGDGYRLTAIIEQVQDGPYYRLDVPLAAYLEGEAAAWQTGIVMDAAQTRVDLVLPARPVRLDVDPEFDVFRRLDRMEIPPAISQALGAEHALAVLPARAPQHLREGYASLAASWLDGASGASDTLTDAGLESLPADRTVWLLGWETAFRALLSRALAGYDVDIGQDQVRIGDDIVRRGEHALVIVARHPQNPDLALVWVAADNPAALPGLGRKLPHYGKYSYLAFTGDEPVNRLKGQWPVTGSPMSIRVVQDDGAEVAPVSARLAPRQALVQPPPAFSAPRMLEDIRYLVAGAREGRGLGTAGLDDAARYIAAQFRAAGLEPGGDREGGYFQGWEAQTGEPLRRMHLRNVIGVLPGVNPRMAGQSVVIGAHYDHLGRGWPDVHSGDEGKIHPGADDNASGVAVMLELARSFTVPPERTLVFVAFTGEEAGRLGSARYLSEASRYPAGGIIAMLNLDTVGRLGERPLTVFGTGSAREWPYVFRGASYLTGVPLQMVAEDYGSSDQRSFIDAGVPAVQFFSGPHADYHRPGDRIEAIDAEGLSSVAAVAREAVDYLASRAEPLTTELHEATDTAGAAAPPAGGRRVSLGTVPDFAYTGEGVRLAGVSPATPADRAGLRAGDTVVRINDAPITDLRVYAAVLRALQPGDALTIHYLRGGVERTVTTRVVTR